MQPLAVKLAVWIGADQDDAALRAAVGGGVWQDVETACDATIRVTGSTQPDAQQAELYRRVYPIYRSLYPALTSSFAELGGV